MKDLIRKILTEGREHGVTLNGFEFYVDDFISTQRDGSSHIFLNVAGGKALPFNQYKVISDELLSVGIDSSPSTYNNNDDGEIAFISTIRVKVDVIEMVSMYLNTSLPNKTFFDKL